MKKSLLLLASLLLACSEEDIDDDSFTSQYRDIPVLLIYSSEYDRYQYEYTMLELIENTNTAFHETGVYFYALDSIVDYEYNPEFSDFRNGIQQEVIDMSSRYEEGIPVYLVDAILVKNEQGNQRTFAGMAFSPSSSFCDRFTIIRKTQNTGSLIVLHELGHLMGLDHSEDEENFMHPQIGLDDTLTYNQDLIVKEYSKKYYKKCVNL